MTTKMKQVTGPKLSYLIAASGVMISFIFSAYIFWHASFLSSKIGAIKSMMAFFFLLGGISLSLLLAAILRINQLGHEHTISLNKMNDDLKKEIEERMSTEESKRKLEIALLQGQKLQAMGTLAGGIAHDFNNILYAIIGYVEIAREDSKENNLVYKNLGKVLEGAHRGRELVSRILSFSRRQHLEYKHINLKTTIESALSLLTPTIPASVTICFDSTVEDAFISADQTQIHQVLVNLINNSVDATEGEGSIFIHLSLLSEGDPLIKQFKHTPNQEYYILTIRDTGRGMNQATKERVFEPFFTTKEVGRGTGLGLSIVHTIIKDHQGEIMVESQLGRGTTFTILLPKIALAIN